MVTAKINDSAPVREPADRWTTAEANDLFMVTLEDDTEEAPFGGVRQKTFAELERSLLEMEEVYTRASDAGDGTRAQR
jgi:hypothetical protein